MDISADKKIDALRRMWLIRFFEEAAIRLYGERHYRGSTHPYIAQEATALGVCAVLQPKDLVLATYRGHGAAIAKGVDPRRMMAELLGKATGLCGGKGGSMHMSQVDLGFVGSNAIVSGHIGIAGGMALAHQLDNDGVVTVCFFGDGASCEGVFYETLNMAQLWKLPLVLVVENNEYAISTHYTQSISVPFISQRAQGFGLPGVTIDGRNFDAVAQTASEAVERARRGDGPTLIEAKTVRWSRHSAVAAGGAGSAAADRWKETDPIPRFRAELISAGVLDEAEAVELEQAARVEIEGAVEFALASPYPELSALTEDIYA
ncbi:MAG: thiamine pyrophosphate-dependent dehydrogenase E1 component subunit alpha [Anaerolineales bacterium]|nr:thiamine pyrophosphate-dependent dehydrogenase E1 component subunit alpha [Anaerolineales bacterium]